MKKNLLLSIFLLFSLIIFSCSNLINNSAQGSLSIVMPGSNGRYTDKDQTELPSTYNIKLTRNKDYPQELTAQAGPIFTIDNLVSGEYEIILSGSTTYYYFEGKANTTVLPNKDATVTVNLTKFRKPLYVQSGSGSDYPAGTLQDPFSDIENALYFTADSQNVALHLYGTFTSLVVPREAAGLKHLYLLKSPNAAEAILSGTRMQIQDFSLELLDINCQHCDFEVSSKGAGDLIIGGNVDLSTSPITLHNGKSIYISKPLPSNFTATLNITGDKRAGLQLVRTDSPDVNLAAECGKFMLSRNDDNQFYISSSGTLAANKQISIDLKNFAPGVQCTVKLKEKNKENYLVDNFTITPDGSYHAILKNMSPYYFNIGKTYTIEVYEPDNSSPSCTKDIVVSENDSLNKFELRPNILFVSSTGDDSANGLYETTAFRTINKAVATIGHTSEKYTIRIVDSLTDSTPVVLDSNGPTDLTIIGEDPGSDRNPPTTILKDNNIILKNNNLTLKNIKCTGTTTLNDNAVLKLDGSIEAGNVTLNGSKTYIETLSRIWPDNQNIDIATITVPENALEDNRKVLHLASDRNIADFGNTFNKGNNILRDIQLFTIEGDTAVEGRIGPVQIDNIQKILKRLQGQSLSEINMRIYFYNENCFGDLGRRFNPDDDPLVNITIACEPTDITTVGEKACQNFINLKSITLPQYVKTINANAFEGCTNLQNINLENVETINNNAFVGCSNLEIINLENVKTIGAHAFNGCTNLKGDTNGTLTISASTIGDAAFSGANGITKVNLTSKEIQTIDGFTSCSNLRNINIPASVTKIVYSALGKTALESVTFEDPSKTWGLKETADGPVISTVTVSDPAQNAKNLKETYAARIWIKQ